MLDQFTVTALLKELGLTTPTTADVELQARGLITTLNEDLLLRGQVAGGVSSDALIKALGLLATLTADTELRRTLSATIGADLAVQDSVTVSAAVDVLLLLPQWIKGDLSLPLRTTACALGRKDRVLEVKP